jgi:hypothetical protein
LVIYQKWFYYCMNFTHISIIYNINLDINLFCKNFFISHLEQSLTSKTSVSMHLGLLFDLIPWLLQVFSQWDWEGLIGGIMTWACRNTLSSPSPCKACLESLADICTCPCHDTHNMPLPFSLWLFLINPLKFQATGFGSLAILGSLDILKFFIFKFDFLDNLLPP